MIPQAYTARDISEAYKWLQTLPPSIREEMKTMEHMVLNYLRAKSMGTLTNFTVQSAPAKPEIQKTLQNLKAEMDQFDFSPASQVTQPQPTAAPAQQQASVLTPSPTPVEPAAIQNILSTIKMDPKSRQIMNEIREGLNLSTDLEVVRMCLVVAHKSIKNLLA